MSDPRLRARDLEVRRGRSAESFVLRVPSLDLHGGEVLAVLGPNGAGKSTLLRALAGLEAGRGHVERGVEGAVTLVFQRPLPFAGSVAHNVGVALLDQRLPRPQRRARIARELERFGIAGLARRRAATLSGGELRRLALARAFARRPAVLLLDEPFDDLDSSGQEALSLDLRRAIEATGVAVALVTHDLRQALLLADRIAVLLDGHLEQIDARERVLARPVSPAVARLVGMSNLVPGVLEGAPGTDHAWVAVGPEHRIPAPAGGAAGAPVWAGIRPEQLKVDVGRGEGISIGKARVRHVVADSSVATLILDWAGFSLRAHLLAGRGLARHLAPGTALALAVRPEDVHLLPREERAAS